MADSFVPNAPSIIEARKIAKRGVRKLRKAQRVKALNQRAKRKPVRKPSRKPVRKLTVKKQAVG